MSWRDDQKVRDYRDPAKWPHDYAINAAAMEAAVAAYARELRQAIEAIPLESPERSTRWSNARYEITAEEMRDAVLALLSRTEDT